MKLVIDTVALPCPRPRVGRFGAYYPPAYSAWSKGLVWQIKAMTGEPLKGNVAVDLMIELPVPASWSKKRVHDVLSGMNPEPPGGDIDNLAKGILDAMTKAGVWKDDRQVVRLQAEKRYALAGKIAIQAWRSDGAYSVPIIGNGGSGYLWIERPRPPETGV